MNCMKKILDLQGSFIQKWKKFFFFSCIIAASLDALFFYIPVIDGKKKCLSLDNKLVITASVLRSFIDIFYILYMLFQFRTGFISPSTRTFERRVMVEDPSVIAKRYLSTYFSIDILSILPLPQVVILGFIPNAIGPVALITKDMLKFIVFFQYVPRLIRLYPLYIEATRTSGVLTETAFAGAAFNIFLYMLASHVIGAIWYLFSIERQESCWRIACKDHECIAYYLYCRGDPYLNASCPLLEPNEIKDLTDFDFGIFLDAFQSHVVEISNFPRRFFYCFWWGLRNLSSLGQSLRTSTFVGEILFAVSISISGLVLFSLFIGNMQKYLQSLTNRIEQMRVKREDAERWEQWMSKRMLPPDLRERIRRFEQYKWQETRGVEEESLLRKLPKDIRRDIKRHLCLDLLGRVPMFEKMDDQLLDEMCDRLKLVLHVEKSYIIREGDPVDEMLFITQGTLLSVSTNGGLLNSVYLKSGDFCGEELLTWALDPHSSTSPISTRTVQTLTGVEASALRADDLKFLASQFRRLHSRRLKYTFRFYSFQWRTWAACFIQAHWRRYCRRKLEKSLREEEDMLQDTLADEVGTSISLGASVYASIFAAKLHHNRKHNAKSSHNSPPLLLLKPYEPDFSA